MNAALPPVLIVDDEKNMRLSLETMLQDEGYSARSVESAEGGLGLIESQSFFMVITDAHLGGMTGYEFLARLRQKRPELPVLIITAYATPRLAVEAIRAGAIDYLSKPFEPEELLHAVARCAERYRLLRENAALRAKAGEVHDLARIIGECPAMRRAGCVRPEMMAVRRQMNPPGLRATKLAEMVAQIERHRPLGPTAYR